MKIYTLTFENNKMYVSAFADNYKTDKDIEELLKTESLFIAARFRKESMSFDYYICRANKNIECDVELNSITTNDNSKVHFREIKTMRELKLLDFALML